MAIFHQIGKIATSSIGNVFKNPLSSLLSGGKGQVLNLKFPEDLGSESSRMHAVQIEIYEVMSASARRTVVQPITNPSNKDTLFGKVAATVDGVVKNTTNGLTDIAKSAASSITGVNSLVNSFQNMPSNIAGELANKAKETYNSVVNAGDTLKKQIGSINSTIANSAVSALNQLSDIKGGLEEFGKQMGDTLTGKNAENNLKVLKEFISKSTIVVSDSVRNYVSKLESQAKAAKAALTAEKTGGGTASGSVSGVYDTIKNVKDGAKDLACNIQEYISPSITEMKGKISLYMPSTMSVGYASTWEEYDADKAGTSKVSIGGAQTVLKGIDAGSDAFKKASDAFSQEYDKNKDWYAASRSALEAVGQQAKEDSQTQEVILGAIKKFGNKEALQAAQTYFAKSLNPQTLLNFKTSEFRSFTLDFLMTPRNRAEADSIIGIVNALTYASTMSTKGNSNAIGWPSFVQLKFLSPASSSSQGVFSQLAKTISSVTGISYLNNMLGLSSQEENERIFKFDKMVITNVNVDYAPNGWTAFADGTPTQVRLTIGFKEYSLPTREKMKAGIIR